MPSPLDFYTRTVDELRAAAHRSLDRYHQSSVKLIALAAVGIAVFVVALRTRSVPVWTPLVAAPVAVVLAREGKRALDERSRCSRLRAYYEAGIARIRREWGSLDDGAEYRDSEHFYSSDLDLFGPGSMFQLLSSARTQSGRDTLAEWMKSPATREEALARQAAIAELRGREDLRKAVALAGETRLADVQRATFEGWPDQEPFPNWAAPVAILIVAAVLSVAILIGLRVLPWATSDWMLFMVLAAEAAFARLFATRVKAVVEAIRLPATELPMVSELIALLEAESFTSPRLVGLVSALREGGVSASRETARLLRLARLLDQQRNEWFTILGYFLLWSTQLAMRIDCWQRQHGASMRRWLIALGEFEALLSLATYAFENPDDPFAELLEAGPVFDGEGLAHPMLDAETAVRNDVRFDEAVRFLIVSGSNMSGKSTFLRAIGINHVLAWMGAPVRSSRLRVSRMQLGSAVRVQDSIVDGRSHFRAEMERLRLMIEFAGREPLLFLADEILSGTNSHDRRVTAEWVIRALVARGAVGAITTHDLALTEIASNGLPGRNVHFTDKGGEGTLDFDFKLRPGLLRRSNALHIARMLGIDGSAENQLPSG